MRYLVTSALPYINGVKHLGNLAGSMLPADVYARFLRARGRNVLFICATDEHGTPAELAAAEAGLSVSEYCRREHTIQADVCGEFGLSFDHFGRSSSEENRELTQHLARKLELNGFLEERSMRQLYSPKDGRFLPDRYVIGKCPHCGYAAARGDQCESCTRVLDPSDLIDPCSVISGSPDLELRETKHLFLLQSKLVGQLRSWIKSHTDWPGLVTSIALKWLDEGLKDRCITRDLKWGVPVPREDFEGKVFYVWFDAPIEYMSATAEWAARDPGNRDWKSWWERTDDVRYVQFMAKDNIPFHTIGFPSTILGSGEPWKLVDFIKGFNWLTYYSDKFSTSRKRGVFMDQALKLLPADYWRYYLIASAPESGDADFSWKTFAATVNADLADNFGNFVNRTLKFLASKFGPTIPRLSSPSVSDEALLTALAGGVKEYTGHLEKLQFRKAVNELRSIWSLGNNFLNRRAPWKGIKTDPAEASDVLFTAVNLIRIYAVLAAPIIPHVSEKVFFALRLTESELEWPENIQCELTRVNDGRAFDVPDPLFQRISEEQVELWEREFAGT